ncbi:MAG: hypothetical protein QOF02_2361 [Blastocatellia bacterium]|jgi:hypothetical protein|nr:hypothetical protein [Blastocatellia bacterium]
MAAKVSERLSRKLKEAGARDSSEELPVIINVKEGADLDALRKRGLKITQVYENIPYIAGSLPASSVESLARLDEALEIDYDGQDVEALRKDDEDQ